MTMALRMQRGVHYQMSQVVTDRFAARGRLAPHHRDTDHDIGVHERLRRITERQHIGGVIPAPKITIQAPAFAAIDEAYGQLRIALKRGQDPARKRGARGKIVKSRVTLQRQRERCHVKRVS